MKTNATMFARRGDPWITERERSEGRIYETRTSRYHAPDLPPNGDKSLVLRNADGSVSVIDVKHCNREPLYRKPVPVEKGRALVRLPNHIELRMKMRRAINRRPINV